jgi:transcription antitermination factor NusA-like protein
MDNCHRSLEYFAIIDLKGVTFSLSMPLGKATPSEMALRLYNEAYLDLQKALVGTGRVSLHKNTNNEMGVYIKICRSYSIGQLIKLISRCYRYCYEMEIPLCLYLLKTEITNGLKKIMQTTGAVIFICISSRVLLFIGGREEECLAARIKVIQMVEHLFGRSTTVANISMPVKNLIGQNIRVFFKTRINCTEALISRHSLDPVLEDVSGLTEILVFDTQKLFYLLLHKKREIEDILAANQCFMSTLETCHKYTEVNLKGYSAYELRKARNAMNCLYNTIIKMVIDSLDYYSENNLIIFELKSKNRYLVIGEKDTVTDLALENDTFIEAEMDIEMETAEFLCGKKNGKITKIMKDIHCTIAIHRRSDSARAHLNIFGRSKTFKAVLEMVENEFPEELTFFIDERHHKRIIGYGGKNIQKIMKKHGVYIKFMSEREREKAGYEDNVIIKTPRKNSVNLERMKEDVVSLIGEIQVSEDIHETAIALSDFYDFMYPRYRLLHDGARVQGLSSAVYNYYIYDGGDIDQRIPYTHIFIEKTKQSIIKTTETLSLEKITALNWIQSVPRMGLFSWLFGSSYSSLFGAGDDKEKPGLALPDPTFAIG